MEKVKEIGQVGDGGKVERRYFRYLSSKLIERRIYEFGIYRKDLG